MINTAIPHESRTKSRCETCCDTSPSTKPLIRKKTCLPACQRQRQRKGLWSRVCLASVRPEIRTNRGWKKTNKKKNLNNKPKESACICEASELHDDKWKKNKKKTTHRVSISATSSNSSSAIRAAASLPLLLFAFSVNDAAMKNEKNTTHKFTRVATKRRH